MKIKNISIFIVVILVFNMLFPLIKVLAKENNSTETINGNYQFASNEGNNIQNQNSFEYRDDCFTRSSFLGCKHLEVLSIQVASASVSYYDMEDKYETDPSENAHNITKFLEDMKFNDISTNNYYKKEKHENSMGVAVGHKCIVQDGNEYTLLAIIPRSAGYQQEWAGNFTVGDGDIHKGFKLARDEILRYVKTYIEDNNITGDLKVWTTGWSRGAAVSNMIGGFFAGGGIEYFGENVTITPEDVYCYTIGTPKTIKDGLDKNEELSVSGSRTESEYTDDTQGESFQYNKGGNVSAKDSIYSGIRSIVSPDDAFSLLPIEEWGFTNYGEIIPLNKALSSESDMMEELNSISEYVYSQYIINSEIKKFKNKTFDLKTLSIVDASGITSPTDFLKQRIKGLLEVSNTNKEYQDNHYQDALKSIAGTFGMSEALFKSGNGISEIETSDLIEALSYSYLAYASEQLQKEGKAENETEAIAIAIEELLTNFTGEEIDNTSFTIDDLIRIFAKYISDNENEPISDKVVSGIISFVPEENRWFFNAFKSFDKNNTPDHEVTAEEGLKAFIKACYYGADPDCNYAGTYDEPIQVRNLLCMTMVIALSSEMPEIISLFSDEHGQVTGKAAKFEDALEIVLNKIKTVKNGEGTIIKTYSNMSEVADDKIVNLLDKVLIELIDKSEDLYGEKFKNEFERQVNTLKENITEAREALTSLMFYLDDGFNTKEMIDNIVTFVDNAMLIPTIHYNEIYLAYARTSNRYDEHYIDEETNEDEEETEQESEESKNNSTEIEKSGNIKTGDRILMWIVLLVVSIIGMITIVFYYKKINKKNL